MSHSYKMLATTIILSLILSCQKENKTSKNGTVEINVSDTQKKSIILEPFTEYPNEIDGCSCVFATDSTAYSQDKHIYINDFATTAFVKIDGKMILFEETSHIEKDSLNTVAKYKAGNYIITVEAKNHGEAGYESSLMTGSIKIEDDKGNTSEQPFYGICGC